MRRKIRADGLTAWTNARLKDDHIERTKSEGALSIVGASENVDDGRVLVAARAVLGLYSTVCLTGLLTVDNTINGCTNYAGASTRLRGRSTCITLRASSRKPSLPLLSVGWCLD